MSEDRREHTTHYVDLVNRVRAVVKGKSMFTVDGKPSSGYTRFVMLAECADAILRLRAELAAARAEVEKAWAASDAASRTLIRTTAALRDARAEITRRDELAAGHPGMCCGKCAREISDARAEVEAMRPVVEAAVAFRDPDRDPDEEPLLLNLWTAVDAYLATRKGEV